MDSMVRYGLDQKRIRQRLDWKRQHAAQRDQELFAVLEQCSDEQRVLLEYLYAYMPLHDLADYDGAYFANHVRHVLDVRTQMPWGHMIPDPLFISYVLPYRVNNENMDDSRPFIYDQLADRVRDLSMYDAIIETNYWCHEHATYTGTDIRTVSARTLMRTALGRCGEQSTFTVTALRSIGIPARQCYTPRWAHCDSNHAWVEAWADGAWHYLGACEPEPVLNEGWFRLPAKRAMLVHTRVPADYDGPEQISSSHPWYTEINVLDRYAETKQLHVKVVDHNHLPIQAEVQFQQYNAAEFYPLTTMQTDAEGQVWLTTGYGDLLVHGRTLDGQYTGEQFVLSEQTAVTIQLHALSTKHSLIQVASMKQVEEGGTAQPEQSKMDWTMKPPPAPLPEPGPGVSETARQLQEERVREGTAIRTAYEQTFLTPEQIEHHAARLDLPVDRLMPVLQAARGNGNELIAFLEQTNTELRLIGLQLLEALRPKDGQDIESTTLKDHLDGILPYIEEWNKAEELERRLFHRYVLSPRIHWEMIAPYRAYLAEQLQSMSEHYRNDPQKLAANIEREVTLLNDIDRYSGMATPAGTHRLGVGDSLSRSTLFVAAARTIGIAARLEPLHLLPQYWQKGQWRDAYFTDEVSRHPSRGIAEDAANDLPGGLLDSPYDVKGNGEIDKEEALRNRGYLNIMRGNGSEQTGDGEQQLAQPTYYQDFTIALLNNGLYETLQFPYGDQSVVGHTHEVLPGRYRLTMGTRLRDGSVRGRFIGFTVESGQTTGVELQLPQAKEIVPVLAETLPVAVYTKMVESDRYDSAQQQKKSSSDQAHSNRQAGKQSQEMDTKHSTKQNAQTILAWLEPEREPTKHLLRELAEQQQTWQGRKERMILWLQEPDEQDGLDLDRLPQHAVIGYDNHLEALQSLSDILDGVLGIQRPVVLVLDEQSRIRFAVQGYKPGTVNDLLQVLDQLQQPST